jgi:hypothetical protein
MTKGAKRIGANTKRIGANTKRVGGRKWSMKYKKSINCNRPKGFSQKQYCKYGRKTHKK